MAAIDVSDPGGHPMTTQADTTDVRRTGEGERAAVAATLAAAFHDDPVFAWLHPDPTERAGNIAFFFDLAARILARHDDTWAAGPDVAGAALWVPHGSAPMSDEEGAAFGAAVAERAGADAERLVTFMTVMDAHHPQEPVEYLWFLGVRPERQGRGIGSALLAPVLHRADRAGRRTYLDATSPRSKALYERHGFRATAPVVVDDCPPVWPMWREPA